MKPLLVAEACNPNWVSVPLVGWQVVKHLKSELPGSHLVTQIRNEKAIEKELWKKNADYTALNSERIARLMWYLSKILRGGTGKGWSTATALSLPSYFHFEDLLWKKFGNTLNQKYDLVHRITPLSPTIPSLLARKCYRAGVPFVWGPINGGAPWPRAFDQERRKEKEYLSYIREAYRCVPGYKSTLKYSTAILVGSSETYKQIPKAYYDKCIFLQENAIDPAYFSIPIDKKKEVKLPLRIAFLGRLVPYKGADILIEAAAELMLQGKVVVDIIGDGPEMNNLKRYVNDRNLNSGVHFLGWIPHKKVQHALSESDVFGFPSIREFGGAVVLEAMALGLVPIIVDYAGPSELVSSSTGYKIPLSSRKDIVTNLRITLDQLCKAPSHLRDMGLKAREHVFNNYTWEIKAKRIVEIYKWVLGGRKDKPTFAIEYEQVNRD